MERVTVTLEAQVPGGACTKTPRAAAVAALLGIPLADHRPRRLLPPTTLTLSPGEVVLITGPSGAGKSTLLRALAQALREKNLRVLHLDALPIPADLPAVDTLPCDLPSALAHLGRAGLSEAHLLLRAPAEFSEGQRFRYRLARFFASDADVLVADEFAATLDRLTARVVAWQLGKFARASGRALLLATTHDDLAADLQPTLHLCKGPADELTIGGAA
jgi:ABC-type ATPase with predicted acetyltransferase domain